jgi:hypothetical protein
MDVLRRHRLLVMSGFVVALVLALLSYVRVSADGLSYRNPEVWSTEATLELSDPSHPELRSTLPPTADPGRFTSLVDQYAEFATSDAVINSLQRQGLLGRRGEGPRVPDITATAVHSPVNSAPTPLLKISGMATTPTDATRLTIRATDALIAVARARQVQAKIPESQRVELRIVKRSDVPKVIEPRSKTTFIIILLAGLTVTVAAAFVRENLQQQAKRKRESDRASVFDRHVHEAGSPGSTESKPVRAAAKRRSRLEASEADESEPEVRSATRTRRRARSSP